ncbi:MAG: extracellular solute-binding protein [Saccharofermentanales bacterium]
MRICKKITGLLVLMVPLIVSFTTASAVDQDIIHYQQYFDQHIDKNIGAEIITISTENIVDPENTVLTNIDGKFEVPSIQQDHEIVYRVTISESGLYPISIEFCPLKQTEGDIEIALELDGRLPFFEADRVFLSRLWEYDLSADYERFEKDNRGNEQIPLQREVNQFRIEPLRDKDGYFDEPFLLYLEKGVHLLKLKCLKESLAVGSLILGEKEILKTYSEYQEENDAKTTPDYSVKIEAEKPYLRSTAKIYPGFDRSSPEISPSDPAKIVLNTIGGATWKYSGEWISYRFDVPAAGNYNISLKYAQNLLRGLSTVRKITIDDKLLFRELAEVKFGYGMNWQFKTLTDAEGEAFRIYLEAGEHVLKLEAKLGEAASTLRVIEDSVDRLNTIYRKIVMITGVRPDAYRDYLLDKEIVNLVPDLKSVHKTLTDEVKKIETRAGTAGTEAAFFYDLIRQLDDFIEDTHNITSETSRLDRFKQNVSGLSELLLRLKEQPLMLDYIMIHSDGMKSSYKKAGIFEKFSYRTLSFLYSFLEDYTSIGNAYDSETEKPLKIWISVNDIMTSGVSSGRDQAELLKRLIDEDFTRKTGIRVNLSLVNTSDTMLQAIVGGNTPDLALFVPKGMPINLAMRGALTDLSKFSKFDEIKTRFNPSSFIACEYNGGIYAIPETQSFNMLFYRKDIFKELALVPPQTWEEFFDVTSKLQKKNMQVGIPESQSIFEMFLLQNGGNIYNQDLSAVTLTTKEAVKAFTDWTDLYKQYELPLAFDFFNRFRTGEMPMGIIPFTVYNQLSVAAPELKNLWEMVPVPGLMTESGINRAQSCFGSSVIVPVASNKKDSAFEFIDWWTSEAIQTRFGNDLETIMGTAARYNSANIDAFNNLKWSKSELSNLNTARESVYDIYQTPASYYISRNLSNAFRKVVYYFANDREVLNKYAKDMNNELKRKRQEFGLD